MLFRSAPLGRFIEVGKWDMINGGQLDMAPFLEQKVFASINLVQIYDTRIEKGGKIFQAIMKMFHDGIIKPRAIHPLTIYPISKAEEAFRLMQTGKHFGKLVLQPEAECRIKVGSLFRMLEYRMLILLGSAKNIKDNTEMLPGGCHLPYGWWPGRHR